jgi:hypothetical protein
MFDETQDEFNRTPVDTYKIFAEHNSILQHFPSESRHDGCRVATMRPFNSKLPPAAERCVPL